MKAYSATLIILALVAASTGACNQSVGPEACAPSFQLVFSARGPHTLQGLYTLDATGTGIKRLTPDSMTVSPRYSCSPDGQWILFAAFANQSSDIWKINRTTRLVTRVVADPAVDDSPEWLHDGSGFVFRSNRSGRYSIWMCDANGLNQRQIIPDTQYTSWPRSSPRLPMIAFSYAWRTIVVLDYQRNLQIPVTPDSLDPHSNFFAWSPSGDKLAFEVSRDLYVWDLISSLRRYWTDNNHIFNPIWSPDGQQIAFNAFDTLKVLNLSSRAVRPLMSGMAYAGRSSWSPDGSTIAVEALNPPWILLVAADGGSVKAVPVGENVAVHPQWINAVW
ncbi:MAG: hypothetical protein FJ215_13540 [Ignavibacteria bacterium]|nr:hypothetical protein [Ignavibacteria bacterium]